jgi:pyridinium-3,5-bisthiocarboxylic acid mononucleotide nickel chelatase
MYGCTGKNNRRGWSALAPLSGATAANGGRQGRLCVVRSAYFDCFSGASGNMLLGALFDAGLDLAELRSGLGTLPIAGWQIDVEQLQQHGLGGTRALVRLEHDDQPHRGLGDVLRIVQGGALPAAVVERASMVFQRLAEVEARIHGTSTDDVEFHEVGAVDAIVDVVGVVYGLHLLEVDSVMASGLPLGSGWVRSAHGRLPVPAPATLELMRRAGAPIRAAPSDVETGELTTPTGAALLTVLATFGPPNGAIERIGYGFGTREPPWPNAVRVVLSGARLGTDEVVQIETNLDDTTPEELGFAMDVLLESGALDVAFSPLQMKKNRPGVLVRVLARPGDAHRLAELVLEHTSALGVRLESMQRLVAQRSERTVSTPWGDVRVKVKHLGSREILAPEYEDCARTARAAGVTLKEVYEAARKAWPAAGAAARTAEANR